MVTLSEVVAASTEAETVGDGSNQARGPSGGARLRMLRFHPALIVIAGACAALFRQAMHSGLSGDVFYEVAAGRWMLAHHAVIRHDVFSYTVHGRPWLDEEWGFQVLLAWLVGHAGAVSYWLVSAGACAGAILAGVARWRVSRASWMWSAALSVLAAAGLSVGLAARPQDLSYLFFALLLLLLALARHHARWLFAVPALLLVWANLHGSFLLGLGMVFLEVLWSLLPPSGGRLQVSRPLPKKAAILALLSSLTASLVNPNGPRLLVYAFHVSTSPRLASLIAEWQTPNFHSYLLLAVIIGPVLLFVCLLAFSGTDFALQDAVLAGLLFIAALHAVRFTPYFVLAACALLAPWAPLKRETLRPALATLPLSGALAAALLVGTHVPAGAAQSGTGSLATPVAATNFLARQGGRVFTTYWWSDYLVYRHIPVFVDGRTDLYFGTGVLRTYMQVDSLSLDPDTVFAHWRVRWVMWDRHEALSTFLSHDARWRVELRAGDAIVFEHVGAW